MLNHLEQSDSQVANSSLRWLDSDELKELVRDRFFTISLQEREDFVQALEHEMRNAGLTLSSHLLLIGIPGKAPGDVTPNEVGHLVRYLNMNEPAPQAIPDRYQHQPDAPDNRSTSATANAVLSQASAHPISYSLPISGIGSDGELYSRADWVWYGMLPTLERRGWFIALLGILAGSATVSFERYRAARIKELNAALTASAELTQQLTSQQIELGKVTRVLALDYAATRALAESASAREAALRVLQTICITTRWDLGDHSGRGPAVQNGKLRRRLAVLCDWLA